MVVNPTLTLKAKDHKRKNALFKDQVLSFKRLLFNREEDGLSLKVIGHLKVKCFIQPNIFFAI